MLKFLSNETNENKYPVGATEICDEKIQNKKRNIKKNNPSILFRERDRKFQLTIRKII